MDISADCVLQPGPSVRALTVTVGHPTTCTLLGGKQYNYVLDYLKPIEGSGDQIDGALNYSFSGEVGDSFSRPCRAAERDQAGPRPCRGLDWGGGG